MTRRHPAPGEDGPAHGAPGTDRPRKPFTVLGIDHIQLAMPAGEAALARLFYTGVLGLTEVRRPRAAVRGGGVWFIGAGTTVHLGVEEPFEPAERAHPAFVVRHLDRARRRLEAAGVAVEDDRSGLALRRCYVHDPFGNRIELIDERDAGFTAKRPRRP